MCIRDRISDASTNPGLPSDTPTDSSADTLVLRISPTADAASHISAIAGRDGLVAPMSHVGIGVTSEGANPWRLTFTLANDAFGSEPLGKNDLFRVCLVAYLEPAAAPRSPSAVWPAGCDIEPMQGAVVRLFELGEQPALE